MSNTRVETPFDKQAYRRALARPRLPVTKTHIRCAGSARAHLVLNGIVNRLRGDPPVDDEEGVRPVVDGAVLALRRPGQQADVAMNEDLVVSILARAAVRVQDLGC